MNNNHFSGVLILDEHQIIVDGLNFVLKSAGFTNIHSFSTYTEGLQFLNRSNNDIKLVISEVQLPDNSVPYFVDRITRNHKYLVGILIYSMPNHLEILERYDYFKYQLNLINLFDLRYLAKDKPLSLVNDTCKSIINVVVEEIIRQNRLSKEEIIRRRKK